MIINQDEGKTPEKIGGERRKKELNQSSRRPKKKKKKFQILGDK